MRRPKIATTLQQPISHDRHVRGQVHRVPSLFTGETPVVVLAPGVQGCMELTVHRMGATVHHATLVMS